MNTPSVIDIIRDLDKKRSQYTATYNKEDRIKYYLGSLWKSIDSKITLSQVTDLHNRLKPVHYDDGVGLLDEHLRLDYEIPLIQAIGSTRKQLYSVDYFAGDTGPGAPIRQTTIVKSRYHSNDGVIIFQMDSKRHWNNFYEYTDKTQYTHKKPVCLFRGTSTGLHVSAIRFRLMKKYQDTDLFDVGFSHVTTDAIEYIEHERPYMSVDKSFNYKFLLSLPGNDNDAGLSWKLKSNSVVLMPPPVTQSWLMEDTLEPNYHYVPVAGDLSDLKDKVHWCINNESKCKQISENASRYMLQFRDLDQQLKVEKAVLDTYIDIISKYKHFLLSECSKINATIYELRGYSK